MLVYLIFYLFIFVFVFIKNSILQNKAFRFLCVVFLMLLGFRAPTVGVDTMSYVLFWKSPDFLFGGNETDKGFKFLFQFLRFFYKSEGYFIFTSSLIALIGVFLLINKVSKYKIDSLIIFAISGTTEIFYLVYFSMIRQSIAISFCLIALLLFFEDKKKLLAYIVLLFSILIHSSSIIILPVVLFIDKITISKKWGIIAIISTYIIGSLQFITLSEYFDDIFNLLNLSGTFFQKYSGYADPEMAFGMIDDTGFINWYLLPFSLISIYIFLTNTKLNINIWYFKFFFLGVILNNLMSDNLMWGRLLMYYTILSVVVIPNMVKRTAFKYHKIIYFLIIIFFLRKTINSLIYLSNLNSEFNLIVPYNTWF